MACLLALLTIPLGAQSPWRESSVIGISGDNSKRPFAVFVRWDGAGTIPNQAIPPDQWITIDLANGPAWELAGDATGNQPNVPADTKAVFLAGLLVITYPSTVYVGTCDLWANFRAPGSDLPERHYQLQTLEATASAGVRSSASTWVPVKDRKFEFYWHHTPGCPSLINLSLQAYVR